MVVELGMPVPARRGFARARQFRSFAAPFKALGGGSLARKYEAPSAMVAGPALRGGRASRTGECRCDHFGAVRRSSQRHAGKLVECIQTNDLWNAHDRLPGDRQRQPGPATGTRRATRASPGYKASADYVAELMQDAGYNVTIQTYKFPYYAYIGIPVVQRDRHRPRTATRSARLECRPEHGTATAALQPAGGIVIPPTPTPSSASGCTAADFSGFVAGPDRPDPARHLQLRREGRSTRRRRAPPA